MTEGTKAVATKIPSLDGLRGFAALLVFASHSSIAGRHLLPFFDAKATGKIGVFLFFLLSSFLLSLPFLAKGRDAFRAGAIRTYFIRRFLRIYPLYVVYLAAALVTTACLWKILGWPKPDGIPLTLDVGQFFEQLFLMRGDGLTWSIIVEFKFYFLLPCLAFLFGVALRARPMLSMFLLAMAIAGCTLVFNPAGMKLNDIRLVYYLPVFLLGFLLAMVSEQYRAASQAAPKPWAGRGLDVLAVACAIAFLAINPPVSSRLFGWQLPDSFFHHQILLQALLCTPVLFAAVHGSGWIRTVFEWRPLRYLGMVSFSMYLWHPVFIQGAGRLLKSVDPTVLAWVSLAATVAASSVSFRLFERPFSGIGLVRKDSPAPRLAPDSIKP